MVGFPAGDCRFTLDWSVSVCSSLLTALHIQPSDSSPLQTEVAQKSLLICSPKIQNLVLTLKVHRCLSAFDLNRF
jgi:hypothetical protein